jgi:5,5'-dehydrodivanillate O-demethylase oxygenase subunit
VLKNADLVHTAPGTLAGQLLRSAWQPLSRSEDLLPGWAKRVQIMNQYVTLYRGEGGTAHVVQDRCPHRNTQLSIGWVEDDSLRCFYHGWKFKGDGTCIEQPCEGDNFARKVTIESYPTCERLGLIFVYLGEGKPPPEPYFPELEEDDGHPIQAKVWPLPFNYFQRLENSLDEAHVHFVHKVSADLTSELQFLPDEFAAEETDYGILRLGARESAGDRTVRYSHFFMPNCNLLVAPPANAEDHWAAHLTWRVPVTDELTLSYAVQRREPKPRTNATDGKTHRPAEEIIKEIFAGTMRMRDVDANHPALFNIQDTVAMTGQGPIYDRENERLGRADIGIILLRKIYRRELAKIAGGRKPKQWQRPIGSKVSLGFKPEPVA